MKLTKVMQSKVNTLKLFISWYEKEYGSSVYMADNEATHGWTLYNIYTNAAGTFIVVDGFRGKQTECLHRSEIGQIYSAVRRGEGESFKIFVNEVLNQG